VCPLKTGDRERTLFSRKAVFGRSGLPSIFLIEKETPFCQANCPAHVDVRGYVARIAEGRFEDAINLIKERLPLPAVLGRVCPNPCEQLCRRNGFEQPVSIRLLKRFVADWEFREKQKVDMGTMPANENNKFKVAIIGSGPAGLTAARDLALMGYKVTIFESLPVAGGMLAVGIPPYRLPKDVLNREIDAILSVGVELKLNTRVGKDISFDDIRKSFDAVFVAVGAHECRTLGIEGENLEGVVSGVEFLREVNLSTETVRAVFERRTVAVIGGGDVAIDAARCAVRLGCENVMMIYRRARFR
jgi:NADPH-dependent glutamate synthase beta subunit-like oxidoreductase